MVIFTEPNTIATESNHYIFGITLCQTPICSALLRFFFPICNYTMCIGRIWQCATFVLTYTSRCSIFPSFNTKTTIKKQISLQVNFTASTQWFSISFTILLLYYSLSFSLLLARSLNVLAALVWSSRDSNCIHSVVYTTLIHCKQHKQRRRVYCFRSYNHTCLLSQLCSLSFGSNTRTNK